MVKNGEMYSNNIYMMLRYFYINFNITIILQSQVNKLSVNFGI